MAGRRGPTLRSQWLGKLLNETRLEAGKTLRDAATYLSVDISTASRYESGHIPVKPQDVESLLNLYEVADPKRRDALFELGHEAWRRDWWDGYQRDLTETFIDYAWLEDRATSIRSFDLLAFPGLIQTPDFAESIIRAYTPGMDEQQLQRAVQFRIERQRILRRESPPRLSVILDEALLHRPIGSAAITSKQLIHLIELMKLKTIDVRVLPYSVGTHFGARGAFQIFDLPEPFPTVGYAETMAGSIYVESEVVDLFVRIYDELWKAALQPEATAKLLAETVREIS